MYKGGEIGKPLLDGAVTRSEPVEVETDDAENGYTLPEDEIVRRRKLAASILETVPREAFTRARIFQPEIGCLNSCTFCSQTAGAVKRELGAEDLKTVTGAMRSAMDTLGVDSLGEDRQHRTSTILPYLDNDIGSYPHLTTYVDCMKELGATVRLSTVGWSRHNEALQQMHERIVAEKGDQTEDIRFSFSPYPVGWRTNRPEYLADFANSLATYAPFAGTEGNNGKPKASIEVRFSPDVVNGEVKIEERGDYAVISCGNQALIGPRHLLDDEALTKIVGTHGAKPILSRGGVETLQVFGNAEALTAENIERLWGSANRQLTECAEENVLAMKGEAYQFENIDGRYFAFEPFVTDGRRFVGMHYYPETEGRRPGVLNATRPLLNNLVQYKEEMLGYDPADTPRHVTYGDIDNVLLDIKREIALLERYSPERAAYMNEKMLPVVEGLVMVFKSSGLPPRLFFQPDFLVDSGVIFNQGRAHHEFGGVVSGGDITLTPNEEKDYGIEGQYAARGTAWRIAPIMGAVASRTFGLKSQPVSGHGVNLAFIEWDPVTFSDTTPDGEPLRKIYVPLEDSKGLRHYTPGSGREANMLPGGRRA